MTAAAPGTITISCPTLDGGTLSVTMTTDPDSGVFAPDAIRCLGSQATGMVGVLDARTGGTHYFTVTPGDVITDAMLAAAGFTERYQVQSLSLALV